MEHNIPTNIRWVSSYDTSKWWELWEVSHRDKWHERARKGPPLTCQELSRRKGTSIQPFCGQARQMRKAVSKLVDSSCQTFKEGRDRHETRGWNVNIYFEHLPSFTTYRRFERSLAKHFINFVNLRPNKTKGLWPLWPSRRVAADISLTRRRPSLKFAKSFGSFGIFEFFFCVFVFFRCFFHQDEFRVRCRRVPRWRRWIEGHEFQTCQSEKTCFASETLGPVFF